MVCSIYRLPGYTGACLPVCFYITLDPELRCSEPEDEPDDNDDDDDDEDEDDEEEDLEDLEELPELSPESEEASCSWSDSVPNSDGECPSS